MSLRYDAGTVGTVTKTPSGGIRVPANIGRTGIQIYQNADGSERREYRPPEEVFSAKSLASLAGAAVTRLHPSEGRVTPKNWRTLAVGNVADQSSKNSAEGADFIEAPMLINDESVINEIDSGVLREISAGYSVDVVPTPGISPQGERYDAVQTNIVYNHVAIGPLGWARAGRSARLRLDGTQETPTREKVLTMDPVTICKIHLDGVEYVVGSESHVSALNAKCARADAAIATANAEAGKAKASHDVELAKVTARADGLDAKVKELEAQLSPAARGTLVAAELKFRSDAVKILGKDFKFDGKSQRDVMIEAIKKSSPTTSLDGKSDDFIGAYFAARVDAAPKAVDYNTLVTSNVTTTEATDSDGFESDEAFEKRLDSNFVPAGGKK